MTPRALMFQGTGSDVGKSLIVAGLCRAFTLRGLQRAALQAAEHVEQRRSDGRWRRDRPRPGLAGARGRVAPTVHMNPVLLKPQTEAGSQVVVQGRIAGKATGREYQGLKPKLMTAALESFARMREEADLVLVEGAGSPAEVNLRQSDIANMGFARAADVPVVLIGDIDRGGVIAQIVGTKAVIDPDDAGSIRGFIINKFRGDASLFEEGMRIIERHTGWPGLGLIPYFAAAGRLPAEDFVALERRADARRGRENRDPDARAYRQFRRIRSAEAGAAGSPRHGQAGRAYPSRG